MVDVKHFDEPGRLAALRRYEVLDTPRETPFDRITDLVRAVMGVPMATISLVDEDRQWFKSCVGVDNMDLPREQTFCAYAILSDEPMYIPDTHADPQFAKFSVVTGPPYLRSYLGIPLTSPDGYNVGSLCAMDVKPSAYTPDQIAVMKSFAALAVDALEMRRIAQIDSLTGAGTRRSFVLELERALARFARHGEPAALLVLDIDHFKQVNDTYGHATGDAVLRGVSNRLEGLLRKEDVLGRLGGEEFGILLGDASLDEALKTAERLCKGVAQQPVATPEPMQVTASFGVAAIQAQGMSPEGWLAAADAAMYEAKRAGRNRCCAASAAVAV